MLVEHAGIKGIKGVPCTVINNTWVIQGAQGADNFFAVRNPSEPSYDDADPLALLLAPFSLPVSLMTLSRPDAISMTSTPRPPLFLLASQRFLDLFRCSVPPLCRSCPICAV